MQQPANKGPLILVADDSRDARRNLQKLLEYHGCRVCTADDGDDALVAVARHHPDLILMDVNMPRRDGLSVVQELKARAETAHIPVILLTALSGSEATLRGLEAGADEFLSKPMDEYELLVRIGNLLRTKQQYDRLRAYQQRLANLLLVSEQLRLRQEPQQLLDDAATLACQHLGFARVVVNLLDPETGLLRVAAAAGITDSKLRADLVRVTYRWADVRNLLRPEYRISESFLIPQESAARAVVNGHADPPPVDNHWQPHDNLLVPLRAPDGAFYGLLSFDTPADGLRPSQEQIQLLELFAHQTTVALQNAYLYADLHRHYARYVAPAVAAQLATRTLAQAPVGEPIEQDLIVMFADLRGFTNLSEGLSPQTLVNEVLNPYFSHMTDVVLRYEGMVDKFLGDGIMALFGVPNPHEDEAARATTAAVAMQTALHPLQEIWRTRLGRDIGMGIGLARGKAIVGNLGSSQRMDYTAIGPVVNLASRIADLAPTGQVWATGELKNLAETYLLGHRGMDRFYPLSFRPLLPTNIRGFTGLQSLYACSAVGR
jgi:class 3 adenylate cyclase/DNA-binding response OmpR family regulator